MSIGRKLRILYSHRIHSRDGQSVHMEELVSAFRAAGHEVLVAGPAAYRDVSFGGEASRLSRLRSALPGASRELAECGYGGLVAAQVARACRAFRPDLIYERCNLFHMAGAWLARRHGTPLYLEVNSPLTDERLAHGGLHLAGLTRAIERWTWRSARRVFPVTAVLGERLVAAGVDPARVTVIPNAIVPQRYAMTARDASRPPVLGFLGFVREWHGLAGVLDAMATHPALPLSLAIAGDGPAIPSLRAQASRLGLGERVTFAGLIAPEAVPGFLTGVDIALQPRATDYASPLKLFDYMAAGCAIIAPDQPNLREVLSDGETALLIPPDGGATSLWDAVERLASDASLRIRLGEAARARAFARHSWAGNAERVLALARADLGG